MRKAIGILLLLLSSLGLLSKDRPNIILVFIDDMGWGDFSCFGNKDAKTPILTDWQTKASVLNNSM